MKQLYRIWCLLWFLLVFLLLFPFFALFIQKKSWHPYGRRLNRIWAITVFGFTFLPTKTERRSRLDYKKPYIYCANHTSYLDIPSLCFSLRGDFIFVGKASLAKVPLFGYMFRNLYISVDRNRLRSKYETMIKSYLALDENTSIAIFPEGTIPKEGHPRMIPFKEGAFRMAIEKQVPIIPVTIPYNWKILPDNGGFLPRRSLMKVIIHPPIETKGMTLEQIPELSQKTFEIIEKELIRQNESYAK